MLEPATKYRHANWRSGRFTVSILHGRESSRGQVERSRRAAPTTLKHLPFHSAQVCGIEHWNAVPNNAITAQTTTMVWTTSASRLSVALGVKLRMNSASDSFEHARLRM